LQQFVRVLISDLKSYDSGEIVCRIPDQLEVVKNFTVLGKTEYMQHTHPHGL